MALHAVNRLTGAITSGGGTDPGAVAAATNPTVAPFRNQLGLTDEQMMGMFGPRQQQQQFNPADLIKALRPIHLGIGGQEITNDNPMGYAGGDPWKNGTFQPGPSAAAIAVSQGNTATNQWNTLEAQPGGITPTALATARMASPSPAPVGTVLGTTPATTPVTPQAQFPLGVNLNHLISGSVTQQNPAGTVWGGSGQTIGAGPTVTPGSVTGGVVPPMRYIQHPVTGAMIPVAQ